MTRECLTSLTLKAFYSTAQGCPTLSGYPGLRPSIAREPCKGSTPRVSPESQRCATLSGLNAAMAYVPRVVRHRRTTLGFAPKPLQGTFTATNRGAFAAATDGRQSLPGTAFPGRAWERV